MTAHACHPTTQETEAGGSQVQGLPGLHSETMQLHKGVEARVS
jgi:hypothetical protein